MTPEENKKKTTGKLQYQNHLRPDLVFNIWMLSKTVRYDELNAQVEKCRKLMTRTKENKYVVRYGDLGEIKDLELYVFLDAAYGNQDLDRVRSTVEY